MAIARPYQIYPTPTGQRPVSRRRSLPPPVGGWNTRDDPVQMGPTDATHLVNWWPRRRDVQMRRGFTSHATGLTGNANDYVDTVVEFFDGTTRKLLAAVDDTIYDATSAGAASSLQGSLTNGRWQTAMMDGIMGLVNGADSPLTFDGTSIASMTVSGSGLTTSDLVGINVFKSRSYFWETGSPDFWYSSTNALGGALTKFALGEVARKGGYLVAMENWTRDGGDGVDDFAVFIMSSGEVIVYQGSDPGSSSDWAKVGSYVIPTPLDIRGAARVGAEILLVTENDLITLPSAFRTPSPPASKLSGAIGLSGPAYRANTGWQTLFYGKRSMLIINVPVGAEQFEQYVVNLQTGAPARFTNQNARCWGVYDRDLYFGGTDGVVYLADTGTDDDDANIEADARQAWNDLGSPNEKHVTSFRGVFSGTTGFRAGMAIAFDFENAMVTREVTTGGSGTPWGSPWGSPWGATQDIIAGWETNAGSGVLVSPQVSIGIQDELPVWYRTDMLVQEMLNPP